MLENVTVQEKQTAYSLKQCALETSLSVPYIRNEIRDGNLRAKKVGKRVLVLNCDLQAYLENQQDWKPTNEKSANEDN